MRQFKFGILHFVMSLAFVMASLPQYSSAATITLSSVVGIKGGKIAVPVSLSGSGGALVAGAKFTVTYDPLLLIYKNYTAPVGYALINDSVSGNLVVAIVTTTFIPDGMFMNLVFDLAVAAVNPQISLSIQDGDVVDQGGVAVLKPQAVSGSVTAVKAGDCDANGTTSIAEVQSSINSFLGLKPVTSCIDYDASSTVSIGEVQKVINTFLGL